MPFIFKETDIEGVVRVETDTKIDKRGCLCESYDAEVFQQKGINTEFQLDLISKSSRGVLRGLHFQCPPWQQAKLIRCVDGEIFDVAVDLRADSETYGEHVTVYLSGDRHDGLYVPRGFAHGFLTVSDDATVSYKLDNIYRPSDASGIHWNDSTLDITWPLSGDPIVSSDDEALPSLEANDHLPLESI